MQGKNYNPILITGADRSGSSLVAHIVHLCNVFAGDVSKMQENEQILNGLKEYIIDNSGSCLFPTFDDVPLYWKAFVFDILKKEGLKENEVWVLKSSLLTQTWRMWSFNYPDAKWVIIRRRSSDIVNSCMKTGYMRMFQSVENQKKVGAGNEKDAWLWWIHQYENNWVEMIKAGLNCKIIWPERMAKGDYGQIYEMIEWLGLKWNRKIFEIIDPLINKIER